jgi:hypothetical protein
MENERETRLSLYLKELNIVKMTSDNPEPSKRMSGADVNTQSSVPVFKACDVSSRVYEV